MNTLYLFNPENDLALAFGKPNYCAPKNARAIASAGAFLPTWLASDGDRVLTSATDREWESRIRRQFHLPALPFLTTDLPQIGSLSPWGWSLYANERFAKAGVPQSLLPKNETLCRLRELSHRRTSIVINRRLSDLGIHTPEKAIELTDASMIPAFIRQHGRSIIKSPWSSSGRGILDSASLSTDHLTRLAAGIIHHQGSVTIEKYLEKEMDFAMLFTVSCGTARFRGLSLFKNSRSTAYAGNIVAPQCELEKRLSAYVPTSEIRRTSSVLETVLTEILGADYEGNCGIDMMIYRDTDGIRIAPCIELNLRTTMGFVALSLAERHLAEKSAGHFNIIYNEPYELPHPVVSNHRLVSGGIDLTPPSNGFRFIFEASECVEKF